MPDQNRPLNVDLPDEPTAKASAFSFLANLLPAINLTEDVSDNDRQFVPRESNKTAERLFDRIARQLHRQDTPHLVLTGPAGIGKTETVRELARRCRNGAYAFLAEAAFLWFDCSAVGTNDGRGCGDVRWEWDRHVESGAEGESSCCFATRPVLDELAGPPVRLHGNVAGGKSSTRI